MIVLALLIIATVDAVSLLESILAYWNFRDAVESPPLPPDKYPAATALICAYLPNEQNLILHTIRHFLDEIDYPGELQVLLVYNSNMALPVVSDLQALAEKRSSFRFIEAPKSTRKATNIRYALGHINTPIVGIFDADARPVRSCFARAAAWLSRGNDFVQGATLIHCFSRTLLTRVIAVEVILKYFISYSARYRYWQTTYFAGSNGYWLTEALRRVPPRDSAQVEDIDMSLRLLLSGGKLVFDPTILAYDEAPPTLLAWWRQRVRWAQGWSQLVRWHQKTLMHADIPIRVKILWCYFLFWRRVIVPISVISFVTFFSAGYNYSMLALCLLLGMHITLQLIGTAIASCLSLRLSNRSDTSLKIRYFVLYVLLFPLYNTLRILTVIRGSVALFRDPIKWHCTPRRPHNRRITDNHHV